MAAEAAASSTIARGVAGQSPPLAELEAIVPVVDARRSQVFYGVYHPSSSGPQPDLCPWERQDDLGVCDRAKLGDTLARPKTVIVGEEALRPEGLPATAYFLSRDFAAQYLVVGQKRLNEPGRLPEGRRLTEWLHRALTVDEFAPPGDPGESARADPGTPESVVPIYIRSPDADVHITRMRDPWADGSSGK
jgi:tRNA A37 threonylcarbamoyladenosine modification protein TsaB